MKQSLIYLLYLRRASFWPSPGNSPMHYSTTTSQNGSLRAPSFLVGIQIGSGKKILLAVKRFGPAIALIPLPPPWEHLQARECRFPAGQEPDRLPLRRCRVCLLLALEHPYLGVPRG